MRFDAILGEPLLEFGGRNVSCDIREGILYFGPLDSGTPRAKEQVRLGFVGSAKSISEFQEWLDYCYDGIESADPQNPNFAPAFPGLDSSIGFGCSFMIDPAWVNEIGESEVRAVAGLPGEVIALAELFHARIRAAYELSSARPDIVVCLPSDLVRSRVKPRFDCEDDSEERLEGGPDFHDYLKALCLQSGSLFQLVWPRTYRKGGTGVQDAATRAWNLFGALFYKAGGSLWKLHKPPGSPNTCYVGISFSRRDDGEYLHSSLTQVFNDKGEGTILRGGLARKSADDHEVHLSDDSSFQLLESAVKNYALANDMRRPDRLVIHKSSAFDSAEMRGFNRAAEEAGVRLRDFLAVYRSTMRLFRHGAYPPLRGSHVILDDENSLLYTRGSVPFFRKYPGPYVPRTIQIRLQQADRSQRDIAAELLALTKLNWNKTQFDSMFPITLAGSRSIGEIYKWCVSAPESPLSYAFFM